MTFTAADVALWMSVAKDTTVVGMLLFVLWGGSRRVWIWGHHYLDVLARVTKLEADVQWWQDRYLSLGETTNKALTMAERRRR